MQGFNQEGLTTGNKLAGKHPLGARARHLRTTGALVVRFEMPFAVWCTTCKPHETIIGQGVRFNAEKKKVGSYYSTPIYSFRMRHPQCGGWIEIRTDPKNTAYVVFEGGRKRDTGEDGDRALQPGEIAIRRVGEDEEKKDALAKLEGKVEDKRRAETETSRILDLQQRQSRDWNDPYEKSRRLRRTFRAERKGLEKAEANREAIKDKMSLGIDLVDETEEDRLRAGMVDFGPDGPNGADMVGPDAGASQVLRTRPMFETKGSSSALQRSTESDRHGKSKRARPPKPADQLAQRKASFRNELTGNTRATVDPFLTHAETAWRPEVKRRKVVATKPVVVSKEQNEHQRPDRADNNEASPVEDSTGVSTTKGSAVPAALVDYGSDSE
ncbi:hypothetical protein ASPWEDRAFT_32533 [Aspergillus wentii DTO 134E9]|uniref:Uncharacterized protein n=1 Tax=Aspergillus wentii DTO 134E9 TaxID=1073089 RepID=A0A1L9R637_ASPWE|nr:uncharacterized protein ASPWEDRAFT_32533 [Aspergillus wentii DTO 134E9]OJJ30343.1 hypothetical protein ASPWEDRAFT_32533 [Aspergillus wentii DTO 134E9]